MLRQQECQGGTGSLAKASVLAERSTERSHLYLLVRVHGKQSIRVKDCRRNKVPKTAAT